MKNYPYLLNRYGRFYFRIGVPVHLRSGLGKTELVYALKTQDLSEALSRGLRLRNVAQEAFARVETGYSIVLSLMQEAVQEVTGAKPRAIPSVSSRIPVPLPTVATAPIPDSPKFSEIYEEYLAECKGERPKGLLKKRAVFSIWVEAQGDQPVQDIGKAQVREFKALLMKLPANMKQRYLIHYFGVLTGSRWCPPITLLWALVTLRHMIDPPPGPLRESYRVWGCPSF